jgi:hypothetical protein
VERVSSEIVEFSDSMLQIRSCSSKSLRIIVSSLVLWLFSMLTYNQVSSYSASLLVGEQLVADSPGGTCTPASNSDRNVS